VARHCGLEPRDVEARLALPDVIKERVRELDAANAKKTALLLTAGFRRAADTIRQTVVHGQTRFQIDDTRLAPEVQRLAQEQPDVAQQVMRSIVGGSQAGGQTISPATPPTAPLDASQIPSVEPLRLEMTLSSAAQRAAVNRIPEQERPARYAATLAAFQEAERRIAAGDKSPAAARERGELRTGRDALAAVLRDTTKTVRQPEAAPAKPRAKSRDQGQER
jgi:hypothetical protein